MIWHHIGYVLGFLRVPSAWNYFWGGFGSSLSELAIPFAAYGFWKKHNCHEHHCPRIGRHIVNGTPWCNHHHQKARDNLSTASAESVMIQGTNV